LTAIHKATTTATIQIVVEFMTTLFPADSFKPWAVRQQSSMRGGAFKISHARFYVFFSAGLEQAIKGVHAVVVFARARSAISFLNAVASKCSAALTFPVNTKADYAHAITVITVVTWVRGINADIILTYMAF
jgi:hypothetical protein